MNGIGLSATVYDLNGSLYISGDRLDPEETQKNNKRERRVTRIATLDGGVTVYDTGYSAGDRSINIKVINPSEAVIAFMNYLVETYNFITVTTEESVFTAVPEQSYIETGGSAVLVAGIIEDIGG